MRRHRADLVSLLAGLLFLAISVSVLVSDGHREHAVDGRWLGPVLLVALGALGLAASVRRPDHTVVVGVWADAETPTSTD